MGKSKYQVRIGKKLVATTKGEQEAIDLAFDLWLYTDTKATVQKKKKGKKKK